MKVSELINVLKKMNPEALVFVCKDGENVNYDVGHEVIGYCEVSNSNNIVDTAYIIY